MIHGSYSVEGKKGLLKDGGSKRRTVVEGLIGEQGGVVEAFYYAFGQNDLYCIVDLPGNISMAAISLKVGAGGAFKVETTVLLTPEEIDEAAKTEVTYIPGSTHS